MDTGAIYRTIGVYVYRHHIDPKDAAAVAAVLPEITISLRYDEVGLQRMYLNGEDVTKEIRLPAMSMYASDVSAIPAVRDYLMELQRSLAREHSVIMDGRDIGTVVLPDADVKVFLCADVAVRARRRCLELEKRGTPKPYDQVLKEMEERDYQDTHREVAPLRPADDAIMIDNTDMDFEASCELLSNLYALSDSTVLLGELLELLRYRFEQIDFIDEPVELGFDCPLDLHCTYTRDQLLVALDFMKPSTVREGVKWLPEKNIDVFFVTLNKADKDYSPTTMYNDYSINESLFHWQSQSTTAENSPTGQRYIHHKERGSKVLLFVREFKADRKTGGAEAYTYLGTANYVKHTGSRPMNITWQLDRPIPAKFLKKTNKLVVG